MADATTSNNDQTDNKSAAETAEDPFAGFESGAFNDGVEVKDDEGASDAKESDAEDAAGAEESEAEDTEEAEAEDSDAEKEEGSEEKKPAPKKTAKQRINELTRDKHEALRRAEAAETRLREAEAAKQAAKPVEKSAEDDKAAGEKPKPENFEFGELDIAYIEALSEWKTEQKISAFKRELEESRQQEAAAHVAQELQQKLDAITARGHEKYEDYEEKVQSWQNSGQQPFAAEIAELFLGSDVAEDVAYHLASNQTEAARIASLTPVQQAAEFARLEARFKTQEGSARPKQSENKPKPSKAPTPPTTRVRGAGGKFGTPPETDDFASFEKAFANGELR